MTRNSSYHYYYILLSTYLLREKRGFPGGSPNGYRRSFLNPLLGNKVEKKHELGCPGVKVAIIAATIRPEGAMEAFAIVWIDLFGVEMEKEWITKLSLEDAIASTGLRLYQSPRRCPQNVRGFYIRTNGEENDGS